MKRYGHDKLAPQSLLVSVSFHGPARKSDRAAHHQGEAGARAGQEGGGQGWGESFFARRRRSEASAFVLAARERRRGALRSSAAGAAEKYPPTQSPFPLPPLPIPPPPHPPHHPVPAAIAGPLAAGPPLQAPPPRRPGWPTPLRQAMSDPVRLILRRDDPACMGGTGPGGGGALHRLGSGGGATLRRRASRDCGRGCQRGLWRREQCGGERGRRDAGGG